MSWTEALDKIVAATGHDRFRELCAEAWPDHTSYRALVLKMVTGQEPAPPADEILRAYVEQHGCGGCP